MGNDCLYVLFFAKCERMRSCDNVEVFKIGCLVDFTLLAIDPYINPSSAAGALRGDR
jgi:hypothetical protein